MLAGNKVDLTKKPKMKSINQLKAACYLGICLAEVKIFNIPQRRHELYTVPVKSFRSPTLFSE